MCPRSEIDHLGDPPRTVWLMQTFNYTNKNVMRIWLCLLGELFSKRREFKDITNIWDFQCPIDLVNVRNVNILQRFGGWMDLIDCKSELTWPPPNTNEPNLLRSDNGTQDASNELIAGKVVPSPRPIRTRRTISAVDPPHSTANGVSSVKMAVDKMPRARVYLPPNFSAKMPPGKWVIV